MKKIVFFFAILILLFSCSTVKFKEAINLEPVKIIPEPKFIEISDAFFIVTNGTKIKNKSGLRLNKIIQVFKNEVYSLSGLKLKTGRFGKHCITLKKTKQEKPAEWYKLAITSKEVLLTAKTDAGFLYGFYTILQLLSSDKNYSYSFLNCLVIEDEPRFEYRGLMLDVSRHFFSVNTIKEIINKIAKVKINKLHIHLTDDGGFRFPFEGVVKHNGKKYDLSAFIKKTSYRTGKNKNSGNYNENWSFINIDDPKDPMYKYKKNAHGGFYTKKELKDLIAYAKIRNIEIIPEIDIPGHSYPLNAFFKDIRCDKKNTDNRDFGILTDICPASPVTFEILKEMIRQIAEVFESTIIHIGSDEVKINDNSWYKIGSWWFCSRCEKKIKELKGNTAKVSYKNLQILQAFFLKQIEEIIQSNGKIMAMWSDGMRGNFKPDKNTIVYFWDSVGDLKLAKKQKLKIINCDQWKYYLDFYQYEDDRKNNNPKAQDWSGYAPTTDLKTIYENNPSTENTGVDIGSTQIGIQANMWTEHITGFTKKGKNYSREEHLKYMIFPRIIALAERAWSFQEKQDWEKFKIKLDKWNRLN